MSSYSSHQARIEPITAGEHHPQGQHGVAGSHRSGPVEATRQYGRNHAHGVSTLQRRLREYDFRHKSADRLTLFLPRL